MICAARGQLPGQTSSKILFSLAPNELDASADSRKPFGQCRGYRDWKLSCEHGYATDDVFFMEVCLFNQLCANRQELWSVRRGQPFVCELSRAR